MYKVVILGLGYVGLTMATCLAERGVEVTGIDSDSNKIAIITDGKSPIHEPGLEKSIIKATKANALKVTSDIEKPLENSGIVFVTVGTPNNPDGSINLNQIRSASDSIGRAIKQIEEYRLIVVRSTVVPGTAEQVIKPVLESNSGKSCGKGFGLCSNPEFLREGSAVEDMLRPDRIIIGEHDERSGSVLEDFYHHLYQADMPELMRTSLANAELIKYANNAFLAAKISFINSIAKLCEKLPKGDVEVIAKGIGLDPRISSSFLNAGLGFGGSCFPKDLKAILSFAKDSGVDLPIIDAALQVNESQPILAVEKAKKVLGELKGKRIAILGLAFKPDTDDMREAASIKIINMLLQEGVEVRAYDPVAMENARGIFGEKIFYANSAEECIEGADCCIVVTEWEEFKKIGPEDFKKTMKRPLVIDGRRLYNAKEFSRELEYLAVGFDSLEEE